MYPIVVVLLDGLGDRAHETLGGRTANEAAATPNLDALAARGSTGVLYAVGPGRAPSSEVAHWSMFGYGEEEFPGRAVFEALGAGQEVDPNDVFAFAALRPAEERDGELWLTGRAKGEEDEDEARALIDRFADVDIDRFHFRLAYLGRGEAILRITRCRRAAHGHRCVLPRPPSRPPAAAARPRGRANRARRRGLEPVRHPAPSRRALQRDHAQVVGPSEAGADLPGAARADRVFHRRVALHARACGHRRAGADRGRGDGRSDVGPRPAARAGA